MPLAQITGVTRVNTTFHIAWALLLNERLVSYRWMLRQHETVANDTPDMRPIQEPLALVSDFDNSFRTACHIVYPGTWTQICCWHVMKNVAYNMRMKWNGSLKGRELEEQWRHAVVEKERTLISKKKQSLLWRLWLTNL